MHHEAMITTQQLIWQGPLHELLDIISDKTKTAPYFPDRLLGFLLNHSYKDVTIVTCDPWKTELWWNTQKFICVD